MSDGGFYRAFEDLHRGSRELIQARLEVYLPFVRATARMHPGAVVADLGCGRGEWLELLQRERIPARGVDLDEGMLAACRERGLDVRQADALASLQALPDNSQIVVSGFHIAEHLPFGTLQMLVEQALRVLLPGGLLILETPNPENLAVGTAGFYMDPTHERPLPPALLAFLPQFHGFGRVKTIRLQEGPSLRGATSVRLVDVLVGVSPDYAVIAQKSATGMDGQEGMAQLDAAFAVDHGVTLIELAQRHERQWESRIQNALGVAEAARKAALAAEAASAQALDMMAALQEKARAAQSALGAVHQSRSWRITRPLRWLGEQRIALRQQGAGERARRLARGAARVGARAAARTLARHPRIRRAAVQALRALGLESFTVRTWARLHHRPVAPDTQGLTPAARRVRDALKRSLSARPVQQPAAPASQRKD